MRVDVYLGFSGREAVISAALGVSSASFRIAPGGKPYLPGGRQFSISHSGGLCVCAVADFPVGVDAELMKNRDVSRLVRALNSQDAHRIEEGGLAEFYRIWTVKEAVCKLTGEGISKARLKDIDAENPTCFVKSTVLENRYMLTLCAERQAQVFFHGVGE